MEEEKEACALEGEKEGRRAIWVRVVVEGKEAGFGEKEQIGEDDDTDGKEEEGVEIEEGGDWWEEDMEEERPGNRERRD